MGVFDTLVQEPLELHKPDYKVYHNPLTTVGNQIVIEMQGPLQLAQGSLPTGQPLNDSRRGATSSMDMKLISSL